MAKESVAVIRKNPGLMFTASFLIVAVINAIIFAVTNSLFPNQIVLGNMSLTRTWALILSASTLSLFTILVLPFLTQWELSRKRDMSPIEMMLVYLGINFVGLWLMTRASEVFGLGVSSWMVVLGLSVVLDFVQGIVMMQVEKMRIGA